MAFQDDAEKNQRVTNQTTHPPIESTHGLEVISTLDDVPPLMFHLTSNQNGFAQNNGFSPKSYVRLAQGDE